jgi:hypothetical protein
MLRKVLAGAFAGAVGTVALNVATYADMAIRGRPPSSATSQLISTLADKADISLSPQGVGSDDRTAQNRGSGLGALLGYVNGLGVGAVYGLLRSQFGNVPLPLAGVGVGLAAMAASDIPLVTLKVSDPKTWGFSGWAADLIPHLIYGLVTVTAYEVIKNTGSL